MARKVEIVGRTFGKLAVIRKDSDFRYPNGAHSEKYLCRCECGNNLVVAKKNLLNGNTQSCGCSRVESNSARLTKHGGKGTRLYDTWCSMKGRCYNPKNEDYLDYGGRGISICSEWRNDFSAFRKWALQNGYDDSLTIDRVNANGNYEPTNCRWTDMATQANNRRNSIYIEYNGERHTCAEWARITGIPYDRIHNRYISGMSAQEILSIHQLKRGPKRKSA